MIMPFESTVEPLIKDPTRKEHSLKKDTCNVPKVAIPIVIIQFETSKKRTFFSTIDAMVSPKVSFAWGFQNYPQTNKNGYHA